MFMRYTHEMHDWYECLKLRKYSQKHLKLHEFCIPESFATNQTSQTFPLLTYAQKLLLENRGIDRCDRLPGTLNWIFSETTVFFM